MQQTMTKLLQDAGMRSGSGLRFPGASDIANSRLGGEVERIYRILGGRLPTIPLNLRSWDMEFDGIAVELDECLHFNRYRDVTLASAAYSELPHFPVDDYRRYCLNHERDCLRAGSYGKKWSNDSCVAQFGGASPLKDLSGNGAPRWKQRAFYDFVKDLSPLVIGVCVVRIAVWDNVVESGRTRLVQDVLEEPSATTAAVLAALVKQRAFL